jgi:hypothetical protein
VAIRMRETLVHGSATGLGGVPISTGEWNSEHDRSNN